MRMALTRALALGSTALALGACASFDVDMRDLGRGFDTTDAARAVSVAPRPATDNRGVISYPNYQVAVAQRGDTVSDVAARVGVNADELARFNGVPEGAVLNRGEILALPRRVAEPSPATGAPATGPIRPAEALQTEAVDVETLASAAIDRADPSASPAPRATLTGAPPQTGAEPIRHKVVRGETGYSIARRYGVSTGDLASWNGLDRELSLREGQFLLIPPAAQSGAVPAPIPAVAAPGQGSRTPTPPSAAQPLPDETPLPAAQSAQGGSPIPPRATGAPPSPDLGATATAASASTAAMATPVSGSIIRVFKPGKNEGIDISAPAGTPVKAAEAGTVAAISRDTDQVPILVLRHEGGLLTVYANVDNLSVKKGDTVRRGQTIAKVRDGDPAYVHFEVRKGLEAVDPSDYISG